MKNMQEVIKLHLKEVGADGLCTTDDRCGCFLGNIAPCHSGYILTCVPAKEDANGVLAPLTAEAPTEETVVPTRLRRAVEQLEWLEAWLFILLLISALALVWAIAT